MALARCAGPAIIYSAQRFAQQTEQQQQKTASSDSPADVFS
jgi:hypothetical protein